MNILFGYNSSNTSKAAIELVEYYAKTFNANVFVATSFTQSQEIDLQDMHKMESAEKKLDDIKAQFKSAGITCGTRLLVSSLSAGENLIRYADEKKVELIVIGINKRSKVGKFLFGSTAQFVILEANCPVVTVK